MRIEKKILPEFFDLVVSGKKTFEIRLADWKCTPGDILVLKEWNPKTKIYTGRQIEKLVTYVKNTKELSFFTKEEIEKYGLNIISIKDIKD